MKKIIMIGMMILVIGIVSAGLLEYYGRVEQNVEIEFPIFYLNESQFLQSNEFPDSCSYFSISDNEKEIWYTEDLDGISSNYIPEVDFYIRAKISSGTLPKNLSLTFGYNNTSNIKHDVCFYNLTIVNNVTLSNYGPISCSGSSVLSDVKNIYYKIQGECSDCKYMISRCASGFYTRMEVSKL